jgi:hypothetical protein
MPHIPSENKPALWHKYFAMEFNNRAWSLAVQERSSAEDREMLNVAHASMQHWNTIGVELNSMRAQMLLAEVHALLGFDKSAFDYAKEVLEYFLSIDTPDWEIAYAYTIYAHAAQVSGNIATFKSAYLDAVGALNKIEDKQDLEIVQKTFDQITKPEAGNA